MMHSVAEVLAKHPLPPLPDGREFILHPIQIEDIQTGLSLERAGLFLPVGYGKTVISTMIALGYEEQYRIVLVPPILVSQWVRWINSIPGSGGAVAYKGTPKQRNALDLPGNSWWIMSYGVFRNDLPKLIKHLTGKPYTTIVDECFVAGTEVSTPTGAQSIETLAVGEAVLTSQGPRRILKVFESLTRKLVRLEFSDGKKIVCTPNHPFFTDNGWVAAAAAEERALLSQASLRDVRLGVQQAEELAALGAQKSDADRADLFEELRRESAPLAGRSEQHQENEPSVDSQGGQEHSHLSAQATDSGASRSGLCDAQSDRPPPLRPQGQRVRDDDCRKGPCAFSAGVGVPVEFRGAAGQRAGAPDTLQAGLRPFAQENCDRGGRAKPLCADKTAAGSSEGGQVAVVRVVRVSHIECESPVAVYNLEVEGCPHYFAEGVLVHNCQNLKNIQSVLFRAVDTFAAGKKLLLLTGTELNNPGDAYAYIKLKTPSIYRNRSHFDNMHVEERDFFNNPIRWRGLDAVTHNLYLNSLHRTKEEVHAHLPVPNYQPVPYDLDPKHKALYDRIAEEMIVETLNGGKIDGSTAPRLRNVLQQIIINWATFSEEPDDRSAFFDLLDMVMDEIDVQDRHSSKLIVWTWFKNTTRNVTHYLNDIGVPAVAAYSEVDSVKNVARFMDDPAIRVLVAQPGSAGAGLNPQYICWEAIFGEVPTRTIPFRQSAGRIDREGQKFRPNIRIAQAVGTVQAGMYADLLTNDGMVQRVQGNAFDLRKLVYG